MRIRFPLLLLLLTACLNVKGQLDFIHDNVAYKTIYPAELCAYLKQHPEAILIDVRTPGEYADTSSWGSLNIGRLKNAINIEIDSFEQHISELKTRQDKPIILYCSHSQRSRRVGKLLSDSGFKNVLNLNGGMSWIVQADETGFPCAKDMLLSSVPFDNISAAAAVEMIKREKDLIIIDVRTSAAFNGTDTNEAENIGRIRHALNIPAAELKTGLAKIAPYKNSKILLYDINGSQSTHIARQLAENGYTRVYNLVGGLYAVIGKDKPTLHVRQQILEQTPAYYLLNTREVADLVAKQENLLILDIRTEEEYNNRAEMKWRNLGHLKNAVHVAPAAFDVQKIMAKKGDPILVYGNNAAVYCKRLTDAGFKNVNLMYNGLWDMVSSSHNVKGMESLKQYLVNHEGIY